MKRIFYCIVLILSGVALALDGLALVDFLLHPLAPDAVFHSTLYRAVVMLVLIPLTLLVGFLIIRRVPGNIVGPLLIAWSGTVAYWSIRGDIQPVLFASFYYYDIAFGWPSFFLMILHFPNGELYPSRLTPWMYRLMGLIFLLSSLIFLSTPYLQPPSQMANPFFLPSVQTVAGSINGLRVLFISLVLLLTLVSPALRFRKGNPRARQQIKWLTLFGGVTVIYAILGLIVYPLLTGGQMLNSGDNLIAMFFYLIPGLFPPVVIGIAIYRHRLWDIDLLIRRTLVYSVLTGILTLIYFGSVVVLQTFFTSVIGHQTSAAIVLSTLAIAALFNPLRWRIQRDIDRRFYRKKYDAQRTLEAFAASLRDQVELEQLTGQLLAVVRETMQPGHVSLWLQKSSRKTVPDFTPQRAKGE